MPDVFTPEKRSQVMSRIRGRGNKETEVALAKLFRANGITGWRRHQSLFGKPDFTFRKERVVVFVDGCFWHGCPTHSNMPVNNRMFWEKKLGANKLRDRLVTTTLREQGWLVLRIWEHELSRNPEICIRRITSLLTGHRLATGLWVSSPNRAAYARPR
jgi:DNA mismatch endonuclease (patch repair protein)